VERFERSYLEECLRESGGVVQHAADRAGISRQMFHRLMKRHQLTR
jgi:DNA-binding NtrC family response regulator